jgi:hypothetical protein
MTDIKREHFTTDRALEYFTEAELTKQMGTGKSMWGITLVKELIDNALDAAETIGVNPSVTITVEQDSISIQDNGGGIPESVIRDSLNFNVRVSDKNGYVSPSRGQQGNALMCVYAVPYVLNGDHAHVEINSSGTRYDIDVSLDQIVQAPVVKIDKSESGFVENGTFIKIHELNFASEQNRKELFYTIWLFTFCNPHADFIYNGDGKSYKFSRAGDQVKWTPAMPLVIHWYSKEQFTSLIASTLHKKPDTTVNEFISQFDGLKASPKQKKVCDAAGIKSRDGLAQFADNGRINEDLVEELLVAMRNNTREIKPNKLGTLDPAHIEKKWGGSKVNHRSAKGYTEGLPYTMSVFFQWSDVLKYRGLDLCLNNSALIDGYITFFEHTTQAAKIYLGDPVKLFIHITYPQFEFMGRGKNQVTLPREMREKLTGMVEKVTAEFTKAKKKKEKEQDSDAPKPKPPKWESQIDVAFEVMEQAYLKASTNNTLPAGFRQVYYAARPALLGRCNITKMGFNYFRTLLRQFERENPETTKDWNVVYDARGELIEPHTGDRVSLGTVGVRRYIESWNGVSVSPGGTFSEPSITSPSLSHSGPDGLYKHALFIEKEGFNELIHAAKIQERFGVALFSTKGVSTFAARDLIERLFADGVTIYVLHDFDSMGFTIARTLAEDTDCYQFKSAVNIVDIGLRLHDIDGLEREPVVYKHRTDPRIAMIENGITPEEANILVQGGRPGRWHGERVELNALSSGALVELIETRLTEHGVKKVVPDSKTLADAFRKIKAARAKEKALEKIMGKYLPEIQKELSRHVEAEVKAPDNLQELITEKISGNGSWWKPALDEIVRQD